MRWEGSLRTPLVVSFTFRLYGGEIPIFFRLQVPCSVAVAEGRVFTFTADTSLSSLFFDFRDRKKVFNFLYLKNKYSC